MAVTAATASIIVGVDLCWKLWKRAIVDAWRYNLWCGVAIMAIPRYHSVKLGGHLMNVRTFTAVIHREDDLYVATCPELGTVSQGATIEDALANLKEATELYLEEFPLPDVGRPLLTTFEATYA